MAVSGPILIGHIRSKIVIPVLIAGVVRVWLSEIWVEVHEPSVLGVFVCPFGRHMHKLGSNSAFELGKLPRPHIAFRVGQESDFDPRMHLLETLGDSGELLELLSTLEYGNVRSIYLTEDAQFHRPSRHHRLVDRQKNQSDKNQLAKRIAHVLFPFTRVKNVETRSNYERVSPEDRGSNNIIAVTSGCRDSEQSAGGTRECYQLSLEYITPVTRLRKGLHSKTPTQLTSSRNWWAILDSNQ